MPVVWPWSRGRNRRRSAPGVAGEPRRSSPLSDPEFVGALRPVPTGFGPDADQPSAGLPAADISGVTPAGDAVEIAIGEVGGRVLLAFLAARCDGCDAFWQGLGDRAPRELPSDVVPLVVTRGAGSVAPTEVVPLAAALGGRVPVVMSDEAWARYRVLGYPFFVLVESSTRTIIAETVGFGWDDLVSFVSSSTR